MIDLVEVQRLLAVLGEQRSCKLSLTVYPDGHWRIDNDSLALPLYANRLDSLLPTLRALAGEEMVNVLLPRTWVNAVATSRDGVIAQQCKKALENV